MIDFRPFSALGRHDNDWLASAEGCEADVASLQKALLASRIHRCFPAADKGEDQYRRYKAVND